MFLKKPNYENLNDMYHLEQVRNQRLNIQYILETYEMIITYIFYTILLIVFLLLSTSFFAFIFKKIIKYIWKILSSKYCMCLFGIISTLTGFLIIGLTIYEIIYDSYIWHNDKLKYQENLTMREIMYTNERSYI
jgi:hypothetical protein